VSGASGTLDLIFAGVIDAAGHAQGDLVVTQASGGLSGLSGIIKLSGTAGVGGTYIGSMGGIS
jgi:hypothetical protein